MRPGCLECAAKHIAQAAVLLMESKKGYPLHKWLAVGHIAEAEDELLDKHVGVAGIIREYRKEWLEGGKDFNFMELLGMLSDLLNEKGTT